MYYSTSPFNGPSSSDSFNNDILDIANQITQLISNINNTPPVLSTDQANILPDLLPTGTPTSLSITLPVVQRSFHGRIGKTGATTILLAPYANNTISINGDAPNVLPLYFPYNDYVYQSAGKYAGDYLQQTELAIATTCVNITGGATFWQSYTCTVVDRPVGTNTSGWGPGITDLAGNGYYCRFHSSGAGLYMVNQTGTTRLVPFTNTTVYAGQQNTLLLGVQVQSNGSFLLTIRANSSNQNLFQYVIEAPIINPLSIYPAFFSDTGRAFFTPNGSTWYNDDNSPILSWFNTWGTMIPVGRKYFNITTTNVPVQINYIYDLTTMATQIAGLQSRTQLITKAYF